jgi:protein SCO1/2
MLIPIKMTRRQAPEMYASLIVSMKRWLYRVLIDCLIFNNNLYVPSQRFRNDDITDLKSFGVEFSLVDHSGFERSMASFKGKIVVLVVGRALAGDPSQKVLKNISRELGILGKQSLMVDVVFVTIDPENDSSYAVENYLAGIDSRYIGLRPKNTLEAKKFAKDFLIYLNKVESKTATSYYVEPINAGLVFDKDGCLRLYLSRENGVKFLHDDLLELI